MGFMVGDSSRPAMCEWRRRKPTQFSGVVHIKAVLTVQTFADMLVGSPGRDRKSERLSQGKHHGFIAGGRSHERRQHGARKTVASQNSRSAQPFKDVASILSTTFGKKLFTRCSRRRFPHGQVHSKAHCRFRLSWGRGTGWGRGEGELSYRVYFRSRIHSCAKILRHASYPSPALRA